jgi:anti-sigma-K factor RskA
MSAHDVHTLTGAYAVDSLVGTERRRFERHLSGCDTCAAEVRGLQAAASRLAHLVPAAAPPGLRDRVLAQAAATRQLSPRMGESAASTTRRSVGRAPLAAAAALAVIATGLGVVAVAADRRAEQAELTAQQIAAVATDPDRIAIHAEVQGGGTATALAADGEAVFAASGLPALNADEAYQLWVIAPGSVRSAGVLLPRADGRIEQYVPQVAPGAVLGLTVEPRNGSPQPTMDPIVTLQIDQA